MSRALVKLILWTLAAFLFHVCAVQTPLGSLRFEWPFFLACVYAIKETRMELAGLLFFAPSLMFDCLDNQFAGSLSHVLLFIVIRRIRFFVDFIHWPGGLLLGLVMAALDRVIFGLLAGFQMGLGTEYALKAVLDPSYLLTVLVLPLGLGRSRG